VAKHRTFNNLIKTCHVANLQLLLVGQNTTFSLKAGRARMNSRRAVMISSTALDLPNHRSALRDACARADFEPLMMETLPALNADAIRVSLDMVDKADVYVGVFAYRYGYVPDGHDISITEMEYDYAVERDIPRLIFIIHKEHPVFAEDVETGPNAAKLETFKERLRKDRVVASFKSPDELRAEMVSALTALAKQLDAAAAKRWEVSSQALPVTKASTAQVVTYLRRQLDLIDADFNFDNAWFTPLQAQVRVRSGAETGRERVSDLLSALQDTMAERLCLVLGLPGAGKSVAMREFARHGLAKTAQTQILPIYVNLRDWLPDRQWTADAPPRMADLESFLAQWLTFENNPEVTAYLADFRRLHTNGLILWIFDSFDELPATLDAGGRGTGDLIKIVSQLLDDFLRRGAGSTRQTPIGVIASRYERKPNLPAKLVTQLEIQPFSDDRIRDAFARVDGFPKALSDELFRPPGNLVPIARTPFYHGLIAEYGIATGELPETTAALFENYVRRRLDSQAFTNEPAATTETMLIAEEISQYLFASDRYGLGAPLVVLKEAFSDRNVDGALDKLERARIIRRGTAPVEIVTFAHRRLHEYFVIRYKARMGLKFDLEWVARDTRERDSAVLHVELADTETVRQIATALWSEIKQGDGLEYADPRFFRALNCTRFLVEAFRTRRDAIEPFRDELEEMVTRRLEQDDDIISVKLAVETIGLVSQRALEQNVVAALKHGDFWIRETAIDACRFLPTLPPNVVGHIWRCVAFMPDEVFMRELQRLRFSFRLSPGLHEVAGLIEARTRDIQSWNRWAWLPATLLRLPFVIFWLIGRFVANLLRSSRLGYTGESAKRGSGEPVKFYISNPEMFRTHNLPSFKSSINSQFGLWLSAINRDRSYGLPAYRAFLASNTVVLLVISGQTAWSAVRFRIPSLEEATRWVTAPLEAKQAFNEILTANGKAALTSLLVLIGIVLSPFFAHRTYPLTIHGEEIREISRGPSRTIIYVLVVWTASLSLPALITSSGSSEFAQKLVVYLLVPAYIIFLVTIVTRAMWSRIQGYWRSKRDRQRMGQARMFAYRSRIDISKVFMGFELSGSREAYVDWLSSQGLTPTEEWPSGRPPNLGDPASTKLAQLEHRWRGFDK
jgi:hypothetical protein